MGMDGPSSMRKASKNPFIANLEAQYPVLKGTPISPIC